MVIKTIKYRGYSPEVEVQGGKLYGKIAGISDIITFEALTLEELGSAFANAVDSYINFCNEAFIKPEKPCI